jgi:hypothetical protein
MICRDLPAGYVYTDDRELLKYSLPLIGPNYDSDNARVYKEIKAFCIDTPAWDWIRSYDALAHGREAMIAIRWFYNGKGGKTNGHPKPSQH